MFSGFLFQYIELLDLPGSVYSNRRNSIIKLIIKSQMKLRLLFVSYSSVSWYNLLCRENVYAASVETSDSDSLHI